MALFARAVVLRECSPLRGKRADLELWVLRLFVAVSNAESEKNPSRSVPISLLTRYTTCPRPTDSLDHLHLTKTSRQHAVTIVREVRLQLDEDEAFPLVRAPHL